MAPAIPDMTTGVPAGVDPEVLLAIGVVCLTGAVTLWGALLVRRLTGTEEAGVVLGTLIAAVVYLLVTRFDVSLLVFSTPAVATSAMITAIAAVTALIRVSRAPI